ncbi:MAG: DUF2235 domain-containing protein [Oceanicaulis sp.]
MKRLIVCCDGTWQSARQQNLTNIAKIAMHAAHVDEAGDAPVRQVVYYDSGVGATFEADDDNLFNELGDWLEKNLGGAIGDGLEEKIFDAYRFLAFNYEPGDEIFVFGFSRGAYTARSLCGLIYASGLVKRERIGMLGEAYSLYRDPDIGPGDPEAIAFRDANGPRAPIRYLGCFDTVGMNGVPDVVSWLPIDRLFNRGHGFHDTFLNRDIVSARHACALDETRKALPVTVMQSSAHCPPDQVEERWFPGWHGGVGGGGEAERPFSDAALLWMVEGAEKAGMVFSRTLRADLRPDPLAPMDEPDGLWQLGRETRKVETGYRGMVPHDSAITRHRGVESWRPELVRKMDPAWFSVTGRGDPEPA